MTPRFVLARMEGRVPTGPVAVRPTGWRRVAVAARDMPATRAIRAGRHMVSNAIVPIRMAIPVEGMGRVGAEGLRVPVALRHRAPQPSFDPRILLAAGAILLVLIVLCVTLLLRGCTPKEDAKAGSSAPSTSQVDTGQETALRTRPLLIPRRAPLRTQKAAT